jgi:hypothetical protein
MFLKELKMLLLYFLVFSVVVLLAFSLSKETGKNTKYARRGANAIADKPQTTVGLRTTNIIEIN